MTEIGKARNELIAAGREMLACGLTWGNAGNLSIRLSTDRYLVTASGTELGNLGPDDFVEASLQSLEVQPADRKPSKETPMHRAIYQERPEINAVLHGSPYYATMIACSNLSIPANWFVEDMYYLERVARVPYHHPGSQGLGEAVRQQARAANILLLENHGVLVYDKNVREAMMGLQTLELVCRMMIEARSAGVEMNCLPPETVQDFLDRSGYRARREWPR